MILDISLYRQLPASALSVENPTSVIETGTLLLWGNITEPQTAALPFVF